MRWMIFFDVTKHGVLRIITYHGAIMDVGARQKIKPQSSCYGDNYVSTIHV